MSLIPSFKAIYASQRIIGNTAEARLEDFEYFENNPHQALMMLNYSKNNAHKIFQSIPKGRESEYIEIVKRAWNALQLPPESAELKSFIDKHEVTGIQQVKSINGFLDRNDGLIKPSVTTVLVISLILFFAVVLPIAGWLGNRSAILGVAFVAIYFILVSKFVRRAKASMVQRSVKAQVNQLPSNSKTQENKAERKPKVEPTQHEVQAVENEERLVSIANREARYNRNEGRKNYRKE